jgi:hypothetical protein
MQISTENGELQYCIVEKLHHFSILASNLFLFVEGVRKSGFGKLTYLQTKKTCSIPISKKTLRKDLQYMYIRTVL